MLSSDLAIVSSSNEEEPQNLTPLFVDLDETLVRTDTLKESCFLALVKHPLVAFVVVLQLLTKRIDRACFKAKIADLHPTRFDLLPYNQKFLEYLVAEHARGRKVILATGATEVVARGVATHLGIFADVLNSSLHCNLVGRAKSEAIGKWIGSQPFAYAGNGKSDMPAWEHATEAVLVNARPVFKRRLESSGKAVLAISEETRSGWWRQGVEAARSYQWIKNVLIFLPLLLAHKIFDVGSLWAALRGAIAFSFVASSLYVVNDLVDLEADRNHPRKRNRIFARGKWDVQSGMSFAALLIGGAACLAFTLPRGAIWLLVLYAGSTLLYSFKLKGLLFIDVILLAGFYTLRIFFGGETAGIPISMWTLAFSFFLFTSLALVKRQTEVRLHIRSRAVFKSKRGYLADDAAQIGSLASSSGYLAILVLALYINSPEVRPLYSRPDVLWAICPLLLYWLSRLILLGNRGFIHDDPIVFAAKDRASWLVAAAIGITVAAAV